MPPASTDCTTDSGAADSAPTWKTQATLPISIPTVNILTLNNDRAVFSGCRMSTRGAAQAPRCLYRKPMFVVSAQPSASRMPKR